MERLQQYNVILLFGPPYAGKTLFCNTNLLSTHKRVCPDEIFRQHPEYNLRQLILEKVIAEVRKNGRVFIDDDGWTFDKRNSYVALSNRKLAKCRFLCVAFHAKHGREQLLFGREFQLAEAMEMSFCTEHVSMGDGDALIDIWNSFEANKVIPTCDFPLPEKPKEDEGYTVKDVTLELTMQSKYQLEVPALFVQWEGIWKTDADGEIQLLKNVTTALNMWYNHNPCGRIIIVRDRPEAEFGRRSEKEVVIKNLLLEISKELRDCAVYLMHVEDNSRSGSYTETPNPGMLAYLQRLHLIDLFHEGSLLLCQTINHQKMAQQVGIRYMRANRVFDHPHLVTSTSHSSKGTTPEMLKNFKVLYPEETRRKERSASIPLYDEAKSSKDNVVLVRTPQGRGLYIAFRNHDVLERYNKKYTDNASEIGSGESNISKLILESQETARQDAAAASLSSRGKAQKRTSSDPKSRKVPDWMRSKSKKQKRISSLVSSSSSSADSVEAVRKTPKSKESSEPKPSIPPAGTYYIMTNKEMIETAIEILRAAGRRIPNIVIDDDEEEEQRPVLQALPSNTIDTGKVQSKVPGKDSSEKRRSIFPSDNSSSEGSVRSQVLDETIDMTRGEDFQTKTPPRDHRGKDKEGPNSSDDEGDTADALLNDLFGSGKKSRPPSTSRRSGFHVPDTSSSEESRRNCHYLGSSSLSSVPDSMVEETPSSKSSACSSRPSLTVPDSLVSESSSNSSKTRNLLLSSASTIPDSFASGTGSSQSRKLLSSASTVPDSFVTDSSSVCVSSRQSPADITCIAETSWSGSNQSSRLSNSPRGDPRYRVEETVTTIPETAMEPSPEL